MSVWKGSKINKPEEYPRVEISLDKINHNLETLIRWYKKKNIRITAVTKGSCGSLAIAKLFSRHDIHSIGDSHIQNIKKMKDAGVDAKFMLLRAPMQHELEDVITYVDFCLNSEITTIIQLNNVAEKYNKKINIILMIELGDLREGILSTQVDEYVDQIIRLKHIHLAGIGANLVCLNGIQPTNKNMDRLSAIARYLQEKYAMNLEIVSGGNSANYQWFKKTDDIGEINHIRIGESILLGTDPVSKSTIHGLMDHAFTLETEVIESKRKASLPEGTPTYTAFGDIPKIKDEGEMNRAILGIGLQDLDINGCQPVDEAIRVIGVTSDHMVVASAGRMLRVGEVVQFNLTYRAILRLMISPYVFKNYV